MNEWGHRALRFENLKGLLRDMEQKDWMITSFRFSYNDVDTIAVVRRYKDNEPLPSEYAKLQVEFVLLKDIHAQGLTGYLDFYYVHFFEVSRVYSFWNIKSYTDGRFFEHFSQAIAPYIPQKVKEKYDDPVDRIVIGSRADSNNPRAIYFCDIRRSGTKADGTPKRRSLENDNKARVLCSRVYELYRKDKGYSFYFSQDPNKEKNEELILKQLSQRYS